MNWICLLIFFHPAARAAPFSFREAARYALEHSPQFDSARRNRILATLERKNARAAFLPSLDFTSAHGLQRSYPKADPTEPWSSGFALTLSETLYDNGESIVKSRMAELQERIAGKSLERERDRLLLSVGQAFYARALARKNLEIQQEQHTVLKLQVELVKDAYRQGVKTRKDHLRFQTQLNRSENELLTARHSLQKAELALIKLMGVPLGSGERFEFITDESPPRVPARAAPEVRLHRDFELAGLQRTLADHQADLAHRKLWPELGASASASYGASAYVNSGLPLHEKDKLSWSALLTVKYNLFDAGIRRRSSEIAAEKAELSANEQESGLLGLQEELDRLELELRQLEGSLRLSAELLKLEKANLALITNEYRQGKVQYLDYIAALQNFAGARSAYFSSLFELRKSLLARQYHEGKIHETILDL